MKELLDLKVLASSLINRYKSLYTGTDIELPTDFKKVVTEINGSAIEYNRFSAVVTTRANLNIYLPNQWFYIAAFFTQFYSELKQYKEIALSVVQKERLKELNGGNLNSGELSKINALNIGEKSKEYLIKFITDYDWWGGGKTIDRADYYVSPILNYASLVNVSQAYVAELCAFLAENEKLAELLQEEAASETKKRETNFKQTFNQSDKYTSYLTALRTKPFMLLAGISGTGKSRIVREMAFKTCPKYLQDKDGTTPGNYCMIEVKPNWHDSTELIGYYSNLSHSYQFKKFVKFLVKAQMNPEVPFFVCLDEMNLAPVEQYFAEILSILETRKHPKKDGEANMEIIRTEVIVESRYFTPSWKDKDNAVHEKIMSDADWYKEFFDIEKGSAEEIQVQKYQDAYTLRTEGLKLPDNVFIIGTVNMDDTTHPFSRKVIDRAMTIEMNGGRLSDMFGGSRDLEYIEDEEVQKRWQQAFHQYYVTADEVLDEHPEYAETLKENLPARLDAINKALKGTPFEVSYRVLNELTIMVGVMLDDKEEGEEIDIDGIINQAVDNILLMKILPRIEGDVDMFSISNEYKKENDITYDNRLEWLMDIAPDIKSVKTSEEDKSDSTNEDQPTAKKKIKEMLDRLNSQEFTRFWP